MFDYLKGLSVCELLTLIDSICARAPREYWTGEPSLTSEAESLIEACMIEIEARES